MDCMTLTLPTIVASAFKLPDPIRAVIFDMDGTLLDTEAVHLNAFARTGAAIGWPMPQELLLSMVGIHRDGNRQMLADRLGPEFPLERFYADSDALFEAAVDAGIPLRPGADLLLDHLARRGIPMGLATSTAAPFAQDRLEKTGIAQYFDVVVTRSDVMHPKPHPEPYLLAAARLGLDPKDVVAVEDSYAGVQSATAAGIATVLVPDLLPPTGELALACAAILPSLADLRDLLVTTA
jgi:HAD superfamily hydrolase (TIGR01509 family)